MNTVLIKLAYGDDIYEFRNITPKYSDVNIFNDFDLRIKHQ